MICSNCKQDRDVADFRMVGKLSHRYRDSWCKHCHRAYAKRWREGHMGKPLTREVVVKMRIKLPNGANYELLG